MQLKWRLSFPAALVVCVVSGACSHGGKMSTLYVPTLASDGVILVRQNNPAFHETTSCVHLPDVLYNGHPEPPPEGALARFCEPSVPLFDATFEVWDRTIDETGVRCSKIKAACQGDQFFRPERLR
jgi:hypothetical protein